MKIVEPSIEILDELNGEQILKKIETCGRICYKSEATEDSAPVFVKNIIKRGHEAVLEHFSFSVKFICDRGVSHEIVRHRLASYCQESTRYCNYSKDKFENELTFIDPCFWDTRTDMWEIWSISCELAERQYLYMLKCGATPQEARSVLPNSLKTELIMSANLREWRHFLKLRCSSAAHPQMREVALMLLQEVHNKIPVVFDDIWEMYKDELGV